MAYMRGDPYIYAHVDGTLRIHRGGGQVDLEWETVEELAAMLWHEMDEEQRQGAMRRVVEKYGGNFGADGVAEVLGEPTTMDTIKKMAEERG